MSRIDGISIQTYRSTLDNFGPAIVLTAHTLKINDSGKSAIALRNASPYAWPNARIVSLADSILGLNGRSIQVLEDMGLAYLQTDPITTYHAFTETTRGCDRFKARLQNEVHRRRCEGDWFYVNSGRECGIRSAVATAFSQMSMGARADLHSRLTQNLTLDCHQ